MKLIVGLQNPEKEYGGTRHNIGGEVVRTLSDDWRIQKKLYAEIAKYNDDTLLAIPTTYMNDSGKTIKLLTTHYKLRTTDILIVHDDLDLPLGALRFSKSSGAAGQKGVQSIIDILGTKNFARLRIGIAGEHRANSEAKDYVLKKFSREEQMHIAAIKKRAADALVDVVAHDLSHATNRYNRS